MMWTLLWIALLGLAGAQDCPWDDPTLEPWDPGFDPNADLVLDSGTKSVLSTSFEARTLTISDNALLVIAPPNNETGIDITISYILIHSGGSLYIGDDDCPYTTLLDIILVGRFDDDTPEVPGIGRKVIAVANAGTIVVVGEDRVDWTRLTVTLTSGSADPVITLENAVDWREGDEVVIASTSTDMDEAEVFILMDCPTCSSSQVRLQGNVANTHLVEHSSTINIAAEVGLLTRNIRIQGEMEPNCYPSGHYFCDFFNYDTYGGHIQMMLGYTQADFLNMELYNMGQQFGGNYPIHYHRVYDVTGTIVRGNSIHRSHSRCVTVHAADGIIVEDNVCYDHLGHGYFLEDGNEQDNYLIHNLGLVTKPGLILPSDRDAYICQFYLDNVYPGHIPTPSVECMGASTFWIDHPHNYIEGNAAAGSVDMGFFFVFHREPTGPSMGDLEPYHGERSSLGSFVDNTAHSNREWALIMDRGVKISDTPTADDPSEFLSFQDYARFMPHENRDPLAPRVPALLTGFNAYRNGKGAFFRGGDVWMSDSMFVDNDVGVTMASSNMLPYDRGSHQEVTNTVFTGYSGLPGYNRPIRLVGMIINDGPFVADGVSFYLYEPDGSNTAGALAFNRGDSGQKSNANTFRNFNIDANSVRLLTELGNNDGDLSQIFYDELGQVGGVPGGYVVQIYNELLTVAASCTSYPQWNAAVCDGLRYAQVYFTASSKNHDLVVNRVGMSNPVIFRGANRNDVASPTTNYQPVLLVDHGDYTFSWSGPGIIGNVTIAAYNLDEDSEIYYFYQLPTGLTPATDLELIYDEWLQMEDTINNELPLIQGTNPNAVRNDINGWTYYYDSSTGLMLMKLKNRYPQDDYNYCSAQGCQRVHIRYLL